MKNEIIDRFLHYFPGNNDGIRVFFAPGRVNLIGEHTDYNGGYVLPAALTVGTYMVVRPRKDNKFHLFSSNFPDHPVSFSTNDLIFQEEDPWGNYPKGIVRELRKLDSEIMGADIFYRGNIPNGAGLSSSASIGMVTAYGLAEIAGTELSLTELAKLTQRVENHFIGVNTGIMDQFSVGFGRKDHALFLNCQTLKVEQVPIKLGDYQLVITNTNKRRGLADSKYNERRAQCEQGLEAIQGVKQSVQSIGEITPEQFQVLQKRFGNEVITRRIRHVVTENERVKLARKVLERGDLEVFGELMKQSHISLRDDYEVTGKELDVLFETQSGVRGCLGTRMTGAGFGGCTVSIVKNDGIPEFQEQVKKTYEREIGFTPSFYICEIGDGVREMVETLA